MELLASNILFELVVVWHKARSSALRSFGFVNKFFFTYSFIKKVVDVAVLMALILIGLLIGVVVIVAVLLIGLFIIIIFILRRRIYKSGFDSGGRS